MNFCIVGRPRGHQMLHACDYNNTLHFSMCLLYACRQILFTSPSNEPFGVAWNTSSRACPLNIVHSCLSEVRQLLGELLHRRGARWDNRVSIHAHRITMIHDCSICSYASTCAYGGNSVISSLPIDFIAFPIHRRAILCV